MNFPNKLTATLFARRQDSSLLAEVGKVFHDCIRHGVLDDIVVDVADYQHVPDGPGVILIGHECNYQLKTVASAQLQVVCWQKRAFASSTCPLTEVLSRAIRICMLLEQETQRTGLFDAQRLSVSSRDRLSTQQQDYQLDTFAWQVREVLSKALFTVPTIEVREENTRPSILARWVAERSIQSIHEGLSSSAQASRVAPTGACA